ncbi:MAG: hypothetical protein B6D55_02370 [Candidatus Omnitrophica bacterium 4484_70.2]|nr:MAG: hypothetical protein B6D55_02370 [Candidatus Omnitrophica bacterium 4484_70.2]
MKFDLSGLTELITSPFYIASPSYIRLPWLSHGSSPTPPPAGTPRTAKVKWNLPWEGTKPPETVIVAPPEEVAKKLPSISYKIAPWTAPKATVLSSPSFLDKAAEFLKWGADTFLKYHTMRESQKFYSKLAEAQLGIKRAEQAIAEAQARIAQLQEKALRKEKEERKILSQEVLKKYAPYLLPIAVGLTVVMILTARKK